MAAPLFMLAQTPVPAEPATQFLTDGGIFMYVLLAVSLVSVTVITFKVLSLRRSLILPTRLEAQVADFEARLNDNDVEPLAEEFRKGQSALSRLCAVALGNAGRSQAEVQEAVQSSAREEIVKLNSLMSVLEVVITIAPLLGLLGTASGLVIVFEDLGQASQDPTTIARGIAQALNTTIAGLAISVPSVIAHSYFSRKIELMSARLEVLLGGMVSACHQHVFFQGNQ